MAIAQQPVVTGMRASWHEIAADEKSEVLMTAMKLAGIDRLWFVSGTELGFFQEAHVKNKVLGRPTPDIMTMTHENACLAAACGETIVTGRPSATAAHVEVGLMNYGGAIHNASRGNYPVLMMSGYPPSAESGSVPGARNSFIQWYQQIRDQGEIVRQYTKWDHKLASYDNPGTVITRAAQIMLSGPQGPAYMAVPREVAMESVGGSWRFPTLERMQPAATPAPDPEQLALAARWLLESEMPVIATSRFGRNTDAVAALVELAELLGALVLADPFRMSFPSFHPLFRGGREPFPRDVDCALLLDVVVPWMPGESEPRPDAKIIALDLDPTQSMTPIYEFPSDLSITADSAKAVPALVEVVKRLMTPEQRRRAEARRAAHEDAGHRRLAERLDAAKRDGQTANLTPRWVSYQIGQTLGQDAMILHELTDSSLFNRQQAGTLLGTGGSSIGWSAPAAIGVKVAAPDRTVAVACGDGSWMFANPTVTTWASRAHKAPVLFMVMNNRGYSTGTRTVVENHPEGYAVRETDFTGGWFDPSPNYAAEAAASGAYGEKVSDPNEVAPAIQRALGAIQNEGIPAVLEFWLPKHITGEV
ncbi:MAG: thiamine pyrophosphate-requiring protein [Chloroflexota bacterium]